MSRIALSVLLALSLMACSDLNKKVAEITHDKTPNTFSNSGPPLITLILATPPINTIAFGSCKQEFAMDDYKRNLCELNHKLRGTTPPWERIAAEGRVMSYQPGDLQCTRTLGAVPDCRLISGMPRPVTLVSPNMGAN